MTEIIVTRNGQITLPKKIREKLKIREGDIVIVNTVGEGLLVSKRNPAAFDKRNFLPENFDKTLTEMRRYPHTQRLRKLGIIS